MAKTSGFQNMELKMLDGATLRGSFFAVAERAPVIIITPGFNCVKEMFTWEIAEAFQASGYNALVYDPRGTGESSGSPRNQIDPFQQSEDLSDIITHVAALPSVDPNRVTLWGISFGAAVSMCTAALDKRAKSLILICPIFTFWKDDRWARVTAQLIKDRQSQLRGNDPFTLPPFNSKGENPIGMAGSGGPGGLEAYNHMSKLDKQTTSSYVHKITLQTYYKLAVWKPKELVKQVAPVPVMMLVPEFDEMSPAEEQIQVFESFESPKRMHLAKGKGHLQILSGPEFPELTKLQVDFVQDAFAGNLEK